jgi:hypothetical protein
MDKNTTPPLEAMPGSTQVAAILGCSRTKAWELMVSQAITSMPVGNRARCTRADLEKYRRRQYEQAMVHAGVPPRDR